MPTWALWALLGGLLSVRGLLAAMETALQGASDFKLRELAHGGSKRAKRVLKLRADPEVTAAALRSGMVLSGFLATGLGVVASPQLIGVTPDDLHTSWAVWAVPLSVALVLALVATLFDVTFRSAAMQRPDAWALVLSSFAAFSVTVLYPMVKILSVPLNVVLRPFGAKVTFQAPPPPLEELEKQLIRQAQKEEVDKGAPQLIRSIFELSDKTCRDVMVPRTEVVAIELSTPMNDLLQLIAEENHSRIPVYQDDIDRIIGILHVRDIVPMVQNPELIVLRDLLRPVVYVPWVKPIGDLLREMQRERIHMAVVVDEYGGFSGIVTLEDILREIVGDIRDEFEEDVRTFEKQADGSFLVDATLPVEDFARAFDFKFPEGGEFETLGGFLSHLAGAIPEVNDKFTHDGWTFFVHAKEGPRLDRIRVLKPKPAPAGDRRPSHERLEPVTTR
ncbi:MAG: hemolysin family protein [Myxococcota bacterium]